MTLRGGRYGGGKGGAQPAPETPPLGSRTWLAALRRLPQGALSRATGRLARRPVARTLRPLVLGGFARAVGIDLSEAEKPLSEYRSIAELFTRRLVPGARSWPGEARSLASPVDGTVGAVGRVQGGRAIQAKGRDYLVAELLDDAAGAERFAGGAFITVYLAPRDYHRIHTPLSGVVVAAKHLPGGLLPVNRSAVAHLPGLFVRNERLVCYLETAAGRVAVVAVGAYNVGLVSAGFDRRLVTNRPGAQPEERRYRPPVEVLTGAEIMAFHLGSTVVALFEPGVELRRELRPGLRLLVGEEIGRVTNSSTK